MSQLMGEWKFTFAYFALLSVDAGNRKTVMPKEGTQ
jgi:hypothetical protein